MFLLLPAAWLIQAWAGRHPLLVERFYSRGAYPMIKEFVGTLTGWFSWSLTEAALVLAGIVLVWRAILVIRRLKRKQRSLRNVIAQTVSGLLALAGLLYAWGILGWGLNYQRQPFATSVGFDISEASTEELRRLCEHLAYQAAELRRYTGEDEQGVTRPFDSLPEALARAPRGFLHAGEDYPLLEDGAVSRAKSITIPLLSWLNLGGIFAPFTSEPNVNIGPPPMSVMASACHEIAHQLGWAREDEASFVGYVACRNHPDADFRYATTQAALRRSFGALARADAEVARNVHAKIDPGILRDWDAASEYWKPYRTRLGSVAKKVNDSYLKSQGQQAGVRSYGMMVDLLVGERRQNEFIDP